MAKFNIKVENIIEKRRIKTGKNNDEIFNFLSSNFWNSFFQNLNMKASFSLTIEVRKYKFWEKFRFTDFFCNQIGE